MWVSGFVTLSMCENMVLKKIVGLKGERMNRKMRKLCNEELFL